MHSALQPRAHVSQDPLPSQAIGRPPSGGNALSGVPPTQLARIAESSVILAALGPKLASLAATMETEAQTQSKRAATIAATMDALARDLEAAVGELRASSGQLHGALKTVERIADHTRLLSINASIEAARAGEHGRAFSVVVDEVKRLADSSGETTRLIETRMEEIDVSVTRVAAVTVAPPAGQNTANLRTVVAVNHEVRGMADSAEHQLGSAASVHAMGDQVNTLTEALLLAVGKFRFNAHARAQSAVETLLPRLVATIDDRDRLERAIESWLETHTYFELAYVTDWRGRQITDNLACREGQVSHDRTGFGRDWSRRPWYLEARSQTGVSSTDVYRSSANGDFCFTVVATLHNAEGALVGVFGSDVNFQRLVSK